MTFIRHERVKPVVLGVLFVLGTELQGYHHNPGLGLTLRDTLVPPTPPDLTQHPEVWVSRYHGSPSLTEVSGLPYSRDDLSQIEG